MNFFIREARKADMPHVLQLINELAVFEKEPNAVEITIANLEADGFGAFPKFKCFVAEHQNTICGMALVYMRYSTWKGAALHLEDLIVSAAMRGKGLGTLLLNEVVLYGDALNVKRISWDVLDWNAPAIAFYEQKGADVKRDWDIVHLDEKGIKAYISKI